MASIVLTDEMYAYDSDTIEFGDCVFENNSANYAATIWLEEVSATFETCNFTSNNATTFSGAIAPISSLCETSNAFDSKHFPIVTVTNSYVISNKAQQTAAIGLNCYQLFVKNSLFAENIASYSCTMISNSSFNKNKASLGAGIELSSLIGLETTAAILFITQCLVPILPAFQAARCILLINMSMQAATISCIHQKTIGLIESEY